MILAKAFFFGLFISLLGQLPLGNINLIATNISVQEGIRKAWLYGLGIAIVEVIYLRIALTGMDWVSANTLLFDILGWVTVVFFLVLGIIIIVAAKKQKQENDQPVFSSKMNKFLLGLTVSAVNPVQIPFWFTWTISLMRSGALQKGGGNYNLFTIGAGVGTLIGIALYIHGGKWAVEKLGAKKQSLNYLMGGFFIIAALIQLYKIVFTPWTATHGG